MARKFLHNYGFECLAYAQTIESISFIYDAMAYFDLYTPYVVAAHCNAGLNLIEIFNIRDSLRVVSQIKSQKLLLMINTYSYILSWVLDHHDKYVRVPLTDWPLPEDYNGCMSKVIGFYKKYMSKVIGFNREYLNEYLGH